MTTATTDDCCDLPPVELTTRERGQLRRLMVVLVVVLLFSVAEFYGASRARSNALYADALHLLVDVFALGLSVYAVRLATRAPDAVYTYGMRRSEPLAALANVFLLFGTVVEITHGALERFAAQVSPDTGLMLKLSCAALVVNAFSAWLLHGGTHAGHNHGAAEGGDPGQASSLLEEGHPRYHADAGHHAHYDHDAHDHGQESHGRHDHNHVHDAHHGQTHAAHKHAHAHHGHSHGPPSQHHGHDLNMRGALLHVMGDLLSALVAVATALLLAAGGPAWLDPVASLLIACVLVVGGWRLGKEALRVLLEGVPRGVDLAHLRHDLASHPGVERVRNLHVWALGGGHLAMSAHVTRTPGATVTGLELGAAMRAHHVFMHLTVQVDDGV